MGVVRGSVDVVGGAVTRVRLHWGQKRLRARHAAGLAVPQPVEVDALLDTGAQNTCVEPAVVTRLGLPFATGGLVNMPATGGLAVAYSHMASLTVLHPAGDHLVFHNLLVLATPLNTFGFEVLLGRDVLSRCRLVYDGRAGTFALRY